MKKPVHKERRVELYEGEVPVTVEWLDGLLSTAQRVVNSIDKVRVSDNVSIIAKSNIYALLGYVSSAETVKKWGLARLPTPTSKRGKK